MCLPIYRSKSNYGKFDCKAIVTGINVPNIPDIVTIPFQISSCHEYIQHISIRLTSRLNISYKMSYFLKLRCFIYVMSLQFSSNIEWWFNGSITKINSWKSNVTSSITMLTTTAMSLTVILRRITSVLRNSRRRADTPTKRTD